MKKRMFITTIVMMLVLAVALTTSSLAWFSSANTSVTASSATFKAATASSSNINLKISDTTGSWGNSIALTGNNDTSMVGVIPTAPLISAAEVGADITTTGVTINGSAVSVTHKGYVWPSSMDFNAAKIGDESNFVIDANNPVQNISKLSMDSSAGYYYDEFYLHNSGAQNSIDSLTFRVNAALTTTGNDAADYTCNAYAAFIIYDLVNYAVGSTIPANALPVGNNAIAGIEGIVGKQVVAWNTENVEDGQIKEGYTGETGSEVGVGVNAWIPFAAFTLAVDKANNDTNTETDWQFADLDAKDGNQAFVYHGALIDSLPTQQFDALTGEGGFTLNSASLQALNNKVVNPNIVAPRKAGSVANSGDGYVRTTDVDSTSEFVMRAGETFKVAFYYWLDGLTMTAFTDTTVSEIDLQITAAQNS